MSKEDLFSKIKKMSIEECLAYHSSAKGTNNVIHLLGVSAVFLMILFPHIAVMAVGSILVYILANLSSGIDETIIKLEEQIDILEPDDE